ncbi:PDR/VanB family oxidoreductase [Enterobacter bugandensis]|uniref:PDR/VanB family oxidoreductase n=1 Tax=Enterobacter TaxID=547 RepID=UPI001866056D|nr:MULTISPECIES: PDR/VanB family oxidoreductase [unclassified Enterobacter cloacae complex]MBE3176784.1 oxidoreductase [Enterobacter cloacae complex sp. P26RS]MBE3435303.1 oxidoreductase [Enterobacter cloacae complex sp. P21RS]MBE3459496.1 oxidoreductase [Enterobacter cloacae complex sp. P21C]MBE3500968.1 oxidoreductase [Enterobacter cloacae complex sp. P2B]MBE3502656.1 oxidoreductase [Enterobacter cloacae complex sp. I11]
MLNVIVDGLWREGDKSLAVRLVAENGDALPAWRPGAHIDVHLPCGVVRQYSLTGACGDESYLICVGREAASRGGSRYVHETLRPGQRLSISAPRNLFPLHQAERVLLLAAGIGITPLYAMALQLKATGTPFTLHYYVRNRENAAFARELSQCGDCIIHTTTPRTRLAEHFPTPEAGLHAWVCGPAGFMEKARDVAAAKGWDDAHIHSEAFQPAPPVTSGVAGEIFTVKLASTGERWPVPADKTIAQVLQENGVDVPLSCEMGICGACLTPVIDGVVDHRDSVQSEAEKSAADQQVALCCSRSHSGELVIAL